MQSFSSTRGFGLKFQHPRSWQESRFDEISNFSALIVYLSNAPLSDACVTSDYNGGVVTTCGPPITRLPPGGVFVDWSEIGFPHQGAEIPHPNATVSGRPADIETRPAGCADMGGNLEITAQIARPLGSQYSMRACLRAPHVSSNERLVHQMLTSVRISA